MRPDHVVLVDRNDRVIGTAEKLLAHRQALLHRAFSVFVFDSLGRLLLQRRALDKYHSGGLWSNTVCSHPRPGEPVEVAAVRRLEEEMGFDCDIEPAFAFMYRADLGAGLFEYEYDHVFVGRFDGTPRPDPSEVLDWCAVSPGQVRRERALYPERFTCWFHLAFAELDQRNLLLPPGQRLRHRIA